MANVPETRCTLKQVAKAAGVSTATVSRVANETEGVSNRTRMKVKSAISDLRYSPNVLAAELARSNARIPRRHRSGKGALSASFTQAIQCRRNHKKPEPESSEQLRLLEEENLQLRRLVAKLRRGSETSRGIVQ
jgi:transcriptional regulator with XRE-family HTH domain